MSGGTITPPLPQQSPTPAGQPFVPQESPLGILIEDRILKTRRQVKGIDIIAGLLTLIVGTLTYLFIAALVDHWLVTGGLGFWQRLLLWAILLSAAGLYFIKYVWPSLVLSINPIFAARTIEQTKPTLKNSLINFLLLRGRERELAPVIYQALEQRAAADLKGVQIETAVDRRPVLHLSYLLLAVVGVICLYLALSPKSPLISAERILWPWSNLHAPTRVTIDNLQPGDTVAFHGDFVTVSADVRGLNEGESAMLHYSTADGEVVDQSIPMIEENSAYRYQGKLPPDNLGLQQDYNYFITAGDFKTATYHIETQISPVIVIDKVDYHYPPYTGILDASNERQGDIRAIEGTQITIRATGNQPIDRAEIDFSGSGKRGVRMSAEDRKATGRFTLRMMPDDPTRPEHDFYQLRFTDKNHRENRRPIRYNIEVLRDLPPEVQIVEPQRDVTNVTEDGKLEIRIRAEDPDFGLRRIALHAEQGKQILNITPLLDKTSPEKPYIGEFQGKFEFEPKKFNLKAGDRVAYWAEAEDNKEPTPNLTATGKQWIVVVAPDNPQSKNDQQPHPAKRPGNQSGKGEPDQNKSNQRPNEQPQTSQKQDDQKQPQNPAETKPGEKGDKTDQSKQETDAQKPPADQSQPTDKGESAQNGKNDDKSAQPDSAQNQQQPSADQANKPQEPIDPNANPGDAIQKILEHQQEEKQKDQQKTQPQDQQQNNQQQNNQQQSGNQQSGNQQSGNQQSGQQSGSQQSGKQQSGNQQSGQQQSGNQQSDNQQSGKQQSGKQNSGDKQNSGSQSVNSQQQGNQQQDKQQSGNQQTGAQQSGEKRSNNQQSGGQPKPGDQSQTDQQPNNQQSSENKSEGNKQSTNQTAGGQPKPDDKQQSGNQQSSGEKQTGDKQSPTGKQPGDKQQGEKQPGDKQLPTDMQSGENKSGSEKQSGDKQSPTDKQPGDKQQSGDKQPSSDAQQSGSKQGDKQPDGGQKPGSQNKLTNQQQTPGAGQGSEQPKPNPDAQGANQQRPKQSDQSGQDLNKKQDEAQSPSTSPKQSDSKGDAAGDRSGGGQQGGGQQAKKPGTGSAGSQTPDDQGGSQANEQGAGRDRHKARRSGTKRRAYRQCVEATIRQGIKRSKAAGRWKTWQRRFRFAATAIGRFFHRPGTAKTTRRQPGRTIRWVKVLRRAARAIREAAASKARSPTMPTSPRRKSRPPMQSIWITPASRPTLALEHLEDQMAKDKPELLEQLGWTREQAQRFLDRWQQLREAADQKGPRGEEAKKQLDNALKSLGLRPGTTYLKHGGTKADQIRDMRDSGRFAPPPDWAEQYREYTRGVANQGKADGK